MFPVMPIRQMTRTLIGLALVGASASALALDAPLSADAHISSQQPGLNFGALPTLNVGGGATALMQFDLSTLPPAVTSAKLVKASLLLWVNRVGTPGTLELQTVLSAWSEAAVSASTAPVLSGPGSGTLVAVGAAGQFVAIDVTAQVKGWINNPGSNFGLALTPALQAPTSVAFFDSKENTATGHVARLDLTLADQGPAGPQGATGASGASGPQGATGPAGAVGAVGPRGQTGATGATGAQGNSGPQGLPGATGATGAAGPQGVPGATGPQGVQGVAGPSGVLGVTFFQGQVAGTVAVQANTFVFVGPVATVVTSAGQRISANGAVSVGSSTAALIRVDVCTRPSSTPAANPISILTAYKIVTLQANVRTMFSPISSHVPGAGSWHIGNCVAGNGAAAVLNLNDWSSGWVMVTH